MKVPGHGLSSQSQAHHEHSTKAGASAPVRSPALGAHRGENSFAAAPAPEGTAPMAAASNKSAVPRSLLEALKGNQFTVLGDTDHRNTAQVEFLARPETFDTMSAAGVKHVFMEVPNQLQRYVDDFSAGHLDRTELKQLFEAHLQTFFTQGDSREQHLESLTQVVEQSHDRGMQVHFVDSGERTDATKDQLEVLGEFAFSAFVSNLGEARRQAFARLPMEEQVSQITAFAATHPNEIREACGVDPRCAAVLDGGLDRAVRERLDADRELAATISTQAGRDRSVIFCGADHGGPDSPLLESLGRDRTGKLDLFSSREELRAESKPRSKMALIIGENKIVATP